MRPSWRYLGRRGHAIALRIGVGGSSLGPPGQSGQSESQDSGVNDVTISCFFSLVFLPVSCLNHEGGKEVICVDVYSHREILLECELVCWSLMQAACNIQRENTQIGLSFPRSCLVVVAEPTEALAAPP